MINASKSEERIRIKQVLSIGKEGGVGKYLASLSSLVGRRETSSRL